MSDSEYESEEDEDYVPEEPSSGEELGITDEIDENKKIKTKKATKRKRKAGIQLSDEEVSNHEDSEGEEKQDTKKKDVDLKSQQRADDLWAAFKRDTAAARPAKQPTSSSAKQNIGIEKNSPVEASTSTAIEKEKDASKKVEITEIFDFAGEEVKVTKTVDASSIKVKSTDSSDEVKASTKPKQVVPMKRPGGLGNVLGKIGKKPKLSTLEKTKLDWNSFKKEKGIEDELKTSNRDGYLEKQAFLSRVDHKQFEIERDVRQGFRKK